MHEWFQIKLQAADPSVVDIFINDYIGDWFDQMWKGYTDTDSPVTAKGVIDALAALADSVKTIRVRINSPGGDVMAAVVLLIDRLLMRNRPPEAV